MNVRAKFRCTSITVWESYNGNPPSKAYTFTACKDDGDVSWAKYTPSGELRIQIDNPDAQVFETGKAYYLDFTPAP